MEMDGSRNVFWGLIVKPGKRYETQVQEPFRITKACIEPATAKDGKVTSVYVECDNNEEFIIANLNMKNFNESIDLGFNEGEKICFKVDGSGTVHLTGNLLDDPPPEGDMFGMDDSSEDDSEAMEDSEEENVEAGAKIKEVSEKEAAKIMKRKKEQEEKQGKKKKAKVTENGDSTIDTTLGDLDDTDNFAEEEDSEDSNDDDDDDDDDDDSDSDSGENTTDMADTTGAGDDSDDDDDDSDSDSESEEEKPVKKAESPKKKEVKPELKTPVQNGKAGTQNGKTPKDSKTPKQETKTPKQETKTPKQETKTPKSEKKTPKEEPKTPKQGQDTQTPGKTPKRTVKGGVQIEDIKVGNGPEAKVGSKVGMYYEGRLKSNNKQFDANKSGKPFSFKLGKGDVIKGWDVGVLGMKVGGKRRLTIPPKMAYGESGAPPDIPPHSTLVFEVECKHVN